MVFRVIFWLIVVTNSMLPAHSGEFFSELNQSTPTLLPSINDFPGLQSHYHALQMAENTQGQPPIITPAAQRPQARRKKPHYRSDKDFGANALLSPFSLPFPLAYGLSAHYVVSPNWMFELEYLRSKLALGLFSFEIGESVEQKLTLQARYFPSDRGSFNFIMGFGKRELDVRLARDLFDLATNNYSLTVSELSASILRLGLANQWQWREKYTFTVDWIAIDIPFNAKVEQSASQFADDPEDREDIEDAESFLKWYPSGAIVKMNLGITF